MKVGVVDLGRSRGRGALQPRDVGDVVLVFGGRTGECEDVLDVDGLTGLDGDGGRVVRLDEAVVVVGAGGIVVEHLDAVELHGPCRSARFDTDAARQPVFVGLEFDSRRGDGDVGGDIEALVHQGLQVRIVGGVVSEVAGLFTGAVEPDPGVRPGRVVEGHSRISPGDGVGVAAVHLESREGVRVVLDQIEGRSADRLAGAAPGGRDLFQEHGSLRTVRGPDAHQDCRCSLAQ